MDKKTFKIWLVKNNYNQKSLAQRLNISEQTISKYCKTGNFPTVFVYALVALEN